MDYENWFPGKRTEILNMAKNWIQQMSANKTAWNIPDMAIQDLIAKTNDAQTAYTLVRNAARNAENTAQCQAAFTALEQCMWNIKNRYFFVPPLTDSNLVSLTSKPTDSTKNPVPIPVAEAGRTLASRTFTA